jgi:hypothetical protein
LGDGDAALIGAGRTFKSTPPLTGLVPVIHVFAYAGNVLEDVDARDKPGHGDFC